MGPAKNEYESRKAAFPQVLSGGFMSQPEDFADAPEDVRHVVKYWYEPTIRDGKFAVDVATTQFLIDLGSTDPNLLEAEKVAADCDLLKKIVTESPGEVREIFLELQKGTEESVTKAMEIATRIGATEADFVRAGGGIFFVILVAVAFGAGCGGALRNKPANANTTPKPGGGTQGTPRPNPQ